ncbi:MAG: HEPN domain-containing protein [Candidatus Caldarchaeum sp.]
MDGFQRRNRVWRLHSKASCFYGQQAAEKAVKALLYSVNQAPWGHRVRVLLEPYLGRLRRLLEMSEGIPRPTNHIYTI